MARRVAVVLARLLVPILAASLLLRPGLAAAEGALPRYDVAGFRDARFGMAEPEVRQSARTTFGVDDDRMTPTADPVSGAAKLIVHVQDLEPGLGEGRVEYLFGHAHHRLFQVDVVWGLDTNPPLSNYALLAGALRLQRYFLGFGWALRSVQTGILLDERAILLFSGVDGRNRAVTVTLENVRYERVSGNIRLVPEASVPTILTVSYRDEGRAGDVDRITRGEF
jgi:hypothetical protein